MSARARVWARRGGAAGLWLGLTVQSVIVLGAAVVALGLALVGEVWALCRERRAQRRTLRRLEGRSP